MMVGRWLFTLLATVVVPFRPVLAQQGESPNAPFVRTDTTGLQVRLVGVQWASRRHVLVDDRFSTGGTTLRGVEALVTGFSGGVMFRYLDGRAGNTVDRDVDVRLVSGGGVSGLELGIVQRTMPARPDTTSNLVRAGLRLAFPIGGSGATVVFDGGGMIAPRSNVELRAGSRKNDFGWDAETVFRYQPVRWRIPAEILVGYRLTVLRTANHEEERGIVMLGAGLNLSGR